MNIIDTLIWLVDFPVRHGYPMVFIAGFSLMGLALLAFQPLSGGVNARLTAVREREGLTEARPPLGGRGILERAQRIVFRILTVAMLAGLVLGILGLSEVPVTHAYISERGIPTTATVDGQWVTFSTAAGETYTLESNFFTPVLYPDARAWIPSDSPVVVRYLPAHPQAFIIDSTQLPE